jgi:hypothetical protein
MPDSLANSYMPIAGCLTFWFRILIIITPVWTYRKVL